MQSKKQCSKCYGFCIHVLQKGDLVLGCARAEQHPPSPAIYRPRRKFPTHSQNTKQPPEHHPRICGQVQPTKRKCANGIVSLKETALV